MSIRSSLRTPASSDTDALGVIDAKTGPYPAARSWSGGRQRIVGKGPLESYCYHAMSRTCGGEVHFDDVVKRGQGGENGVRVQLLDN